MASAVIHMCVANELNKKLKRNNDLVVIGSVAPDIAKHLGETKTKSHFQDNDDDIPIIERFLDKYQKQLSDDFVLGYYIHLYTDYLWFKYFIPDFMANGKIYMLDGTIIPASEKDYKKYFYNDYTNLNAILIEEYNLELNILENKIPKMKNIITEIPMNQIQLIVDKTLSIIKKSQETKAYVIDKEIVNKFIDYTIEAIYSNLEEIGYTKN